MAQNELQIVTFEQAKRLKAAGFDWETTYNYSKLYGTEEELLFMFSEVLQRVPVPLNGNSTDVVRQDAFSAPTVALALKGFRDVKGGVFMLGSLIIRDVDGEMQISHKYALCTDIETDSAKREIFPTCEEAESALLGALLDSLEDK